jgi:hypothetical protein
MIIGNWSFNKSELCIHMRLKMYNIEFFQDGSMMNVSTSIQVLDK